MCAAAISNAVSVCATGMDVTDLDASALATTYLIISSSNVARLGNLKPPHASANTSAISSTA
jgi:hypothetical protein